MHVRARDSLDEVAQVQVGEDRVGRAPRQQDRDGETPDAVGDRAQGRHGRVIVLQWDVGHEVGDPRRRGLARLQAQVQRGEHDIGSPRPMVIPLRDERVERLLHAFDRVMDLEGALGQQEQAAKAQDQVTARHAPTADKEPRLHQAREPDDREQQRHARDHREREAGDACGLAPLRRQAPDEDRDEDQVVDAENDLERRQRQESDPGLRVREKFDHGMSSMTSLRSRGKRSSDLRSMSSADVAAMKIDE